jgi:hypothetical protein
MPWLPNKLNPPSEKLVIVVAVVYERTFAADSSFHCIGEAGAIIVSSTDIVPEG